MNTQQHHGATVAITSAETRWMVASPLIQLLNMLALLALAGLGLWANHVTKIPIEVHMKYSAIIIVAPMVLTGLLLGLMELFRAISWTTPVRFILSKTVPQGIVPGLQGILKKQWPLMLTMLLTEHAHNEEGQKTSNEKRTEIIKMATRNQLMLHSKVIRMAVQMTIKTIKEHALPILPLAVWVIATALLRFYTVPAWVITLTPVLVAVGFLTYSVLFTRKLRGITKQTHGRASMSDGMISYTLHRLWWGDNPAAEGINKDPYTNAIAMFITVEQEIIKTQSSTPAFVTAALLQKHYPITAATLETMPGSSGMVPDKLEDVIFKQVMKGNDLDKVAELAANNQTRYSSQFLRYIVTRLKPEIEGVQQLPRLQMFYKLRDTAKEFQKEFPEFDKERIEVPIEVPQENAP